MDTNFLLSEAKKAYDMRQYPKAYPLFAKLAKKGLVEANHYLGLMNFYGQAISKNEDVAFRFFSKAARELFSDSIAMLGRCYEEGRGTNQDYKQAYEYYVAAATQGNAEGMIRQAKFHEQGLFVPKDMAKAIQLYVDLAKKDNPYAMYKIGMAYFHGEGVKKSLESAYAWLNKALSKGSIDAMNHFRFLGTKSATDLRTSTAILTHGKDLFASESPESAIIYFEIAAREGLTEAYRYLRDAYDQGKGVKQSPEKAFQMALAGAMKEDDEQMRILAKKYEMGHGVPSSFLKAAEWLEKASKLGNSAARTELLGLRGFIDE
ncbi:MAG: hypothetical protein PHP78_04235 [Candidatus Izemoplasmatales bacterium]|nr:hypothetical protein [Candidatus Izemoplasmatales bacterium]